MPSGSSSGSLFSIYPPQNVVQSNRNKAPAADQAGWDGSSAARGRGRNRAASAPQTWLEPAGVRAGQGLPNLALPKGRLRGETVLLKPKSLFDTASLQRHKTPKALRSRCCEEEFTTSWKMPLQKLRELMSWVCIHNPTLLSIFLAYPQLMYKNEEGFVFCTEIRGRKGVLVLFLFFCGVGGVPIPFPLFFGCPLLCKYLLCQ